MTWKDMLKNGLSVHKMVQRFRDTGHLVFKITSSLSRGTLKQKKGRCTIHFSGDSMDTELLIQPIHSANQLSVYGIGVINSVWQRRKRTSRYFCRPKFWPWWNQKKWNCSYLLRLRHLETGSNEARWASKHWKRRFSLHNYVKKPSSNILWSPGIIAKFDWMRTTGGNNDFSVPRICEFSILSENQSFGSYSRRHNHWTSSGSSCCENSWRIWNGDRNSINCKPRKHLLLC